MTEGVRTVGVTRIGDAATTESDSVAVEEPLEIRLGGESLVVTMRTPGHDEELAAGFLFAESLIERGDDIESIERCDPTRCPGVDRETAKNVLIVSVSNSESVDRSRSRRNFTAVSSCGVCGKTSIEQLQASAEPIESGLTISADTIRSLPDRMRAAQPVFDRTGGLHAAGLFDSEGNIVCIREDIGRHNAVDKVIGRSVLDGRCALSDRVLLVSGRASFEVLQKALRARIPIVASVSAASSLAVDLAKDGGQTLIGFLRGRSMTVYTGEQRSV